MKDGDRRTLISHMISILCNFQCELGCHINIIVFNFAPTMLIFNATTELGCHIREIALPLLPKFLRSKRVCYP